MSDFKFQPTPRHASSQVPVETDSFELSRELLGLTTGTIRPLVKEDAPSPEFKKLSETVAGCFEGWHMLGSEKIDKNHLVEKLLPMRWKALRTLQQDRQLTTKDIQKASNVKLDLSAPLAEAALQHLNNGDIGSKEKFLAAYVNWIKNSFTDSLRLAERGFIFDRSFPDTAFEPHIKPYQKVRIFREGLGKLHNQAFSAAETGAIALHKLCEVAEYQGELRERTAVVLQLHKWQGLDKRLGRAAVVSDYFTRQKAALATEETEQRPFQEALYGINSRMHDVMLRYVPHDVDLNLADLSLNALAPRFKASEKTKRVTNYVQRRYGKEASDDPLIILCPTKVEATYFAMTVGETMYTAKKKSGAILSSHDGVRRRERTLYELNLGIHGFVATTPIEIVPTDTFKKDREVTILVTGHSRARLTQYPFIRDLIEDSIPVRIVAFATLGTTDANARNWVKGQKKSQSRLSEVFDSGRISSPEQLAYFDSLVRNQDALDNRTPKQVEMLMDIYRSLEALKHSIHTSQTLSRPDFEGSRNHLSKLISLASKKLGVESTRVKFERDLTTLLTVEMERARGLFLEASQLSETEIKNYAQFFAVLTTLLDQPKGDVFGVGRKSITAAMANHLNGIHEERTESDEHTLRVVFGVEKLRLFMAQKISRALDLMEAGEQFPTPATGLKLEDARAILL